MSMLDFNAHSQLSAVVKTNVAEASEIANTKSSMGLFLVCITTSDQVLVLPEYSASVRNDIARVVYDNVNGYAISAKTGEIK